MDIPFHKAGHVQTKEFFRKYCQFETPSPNTLRSFSDTIYNDQMEAVRVAIGDSPIFIMIDGTSDKAVSIMFIRLLPILNVICLIVFLFERKL